MAKRKIYVVVRGREPGVYDTWSGESGAAQQVQGFSGALYKAFVRREDALAWLETLDEEQLPGELHRTLTESLVDGENGERREDETEPEQRAREKNVTIHTDGGAIGNPGPGGYGVVLRYGPHRKELSGGYRMTTNNRMELMACIVALEALKEPCSAVLYSDSRYVVDGITKGWAKRWRRHGWERTRGEKAENVDLWVRLLSLYEKHDVTFRWVKGHAGRPDNERADQLATKAAQRENLPPDIRFEAGETDSLRPRLF
jgi:ribonuclease HI